jgi:hypothetical protein
MMRPFLQYCLAIALVLVAGIALADDPKTALGKWMKPNMGAPMSGDSIDFATLAKSFATIAKYPPDPAKYPGWADIANRGAAAAAKSDKDGVKAACNDCHKAAATDGASKNRKAQYQADPNVPKTFPPGP